MDIKNFRYYLQDATNFFTLLDYEISDDPYENKDKMFLNWLFDPFKHSSSEFFVSEDAFIVRKVIDKGDEKAALLSVFDAVVRYYSFCEFVIGDTNIKYAAKKNNSHCLLNATIGGESHTLVEVKMYSTKTKTVVESVVLDPCIIEFLGNIGVKHRDPEVLEVIGSDDVIHTVEEEDPQEAAFLSRRFMFDEITGENDDGDPQSVLVTKTARQILDEYWLFWSEQMRNKWSDKEGGE